MLTICLITCEDPTDYVIRELTIWNKYISNGYDNYDGEIEINFRLESQNWLWYYEAGDRPKIHSDQSRNWRFEFPAEVDSIFVHARFFYTKDLQIQIVAADTTLRMDSDKTFTFWNCGDSTRTEYPFPACLTVIDTLIGQF